MPQVLNQLYVGCNGLSYQIRTAPESELDGTALSPVCDSSVMIATVTLASNSSIESLTDLTQNRSPNNAHLNLDKHCGEPAETKQNSSHDFLQTDRTLFGLNLNMHRPGEH